MNYQVKITVNVYAQTHAEALRKIQDAIEPPNSRRADTGMYIETVDKCAPVAK